MTEEKFRFVALQLCGLMAFIFGLQVFTGLDPGFNASSSAWWKFFASVLGHSGPEHLFNNLFFLGLFGSLFEKLSSGRLFLITFFVSALFANLTAFIFFPGTAIIGASGGAFGVLAAFAVYKPNKIGLALGVPLPMWAVLAAYTLTNFAGLTGANNVAHEAHLFGMLVGSIIGYRLRDQGFLSEKDSESSEENDWKHRIREWEEKWMMNS